MDNDQHLAPQTLSTAELISNGGFPSRGLRIIVPGALGGPVDMGARLVGEKLGERWNTPVTMENMSMNVGLLIAASAAPDGHTLTIAGSSYYINAALYRKLPFDAVHAFVPVSLFASVANVLVVHPSLPIGSMKELISYARSHPGELKYASSGSDTPPHIAGAIFRRMAGIDIGHVPYKGHVAAGKALMKGEEVQLMFDAILTARSHLAAGEVRSLAVTTAKRVPVLPDVPTMTECGFEGYNINPAMGVVAPAGTPPATIALLDREIQAIASTEEVKRRLQENGMQPMQSTPAEFAVHMKQEFTRWARLLDEAGVPVLDAPGK